MEQKMNILTKFSKHQEIKALLKKEQKLDTHESEFLDNISEDDNDADSDYVTETPQNKTKKSILQKKTPSETSSFSKSKKEAL